ncbi:hypothetical protein FH609_003755 [Streptomyces sp. 3MP-14]|uniref:Uncharacterized protein n=1 Tax=Streptomyces mimosae TaxID=2586635 RepID=A0A5N6A610_9ACTN|nr:MULTISPECIES: hypothetical protein [Streptomyces]KAB8162858.1 hypothetical protein FH607_019620 [Streptomyces mimosae]KAB8179071.1 hypothetical protein FH609_003755 [Streptomyces sp. 3MP-14]
MADERSNEPVNEPVNEPAHGPANEPANGPASDAREAAAERHDPAPGDEAEARGAADAARRARVRLAILTGATVGAAVVVSVLNHDPGTTSVSINIDIG